MIDMSADLYKSAIPAIIALFGVITGLFLSLVKDYVDRKEYYKRQLAQNLYSLELDINILFIEVKEYLIADPKPLNARDLKSKANQLKARALTSINTTKYRKGIYEFIENVISAVNEYDTRVCSREIIINKLDGYYSKYNDIVVKLTESSGFKR